MALQTGTWKVNVNGTEGDLQLSAVSPQGAVTGLIFGLPIVGLWDEVSQTIAFIRQEYSLQVPGCPPVPHRTIPHFFKGYLFSTPPAPQPGQDVLWTLAGSVADPVGEAATGIAGGTARRNEFGWFAQATQLV